MRHVTVGSIHSCIIVAFFKQPIKPFLEFPYSTVGAPSTPTYASAEGLSEVASHHVQRASPNISKGHQHIASHYRSVQ